MNRKAIFITCIIVIAYLLGFLLSQKQTMRDPQNIPSATRHYCLDSDTVITTDINTGILCRSDISFYTLKGTSKKSIKELSIKADYFLGSFGYFSSIEQDRILRFYRMTTAQSVELVATFDLSPKETIHSQFLYQTEDSTTHLFLSGEYDVQSQKQPKAFLTHFMIEQNSVIKKETYIFTELLKLKDVVVHEGSYYALLSEMYPFLEPKKRVLLLQQGETPTRISCTAESAKLFVFYLDDFCLVDDNNKLYTSKSGDLIFHEKERSLQWVQYEMSQTHLILSAVDIQSLELFARTSTRIGKRVYNCFDFTESLQITLRLCIPTI